MVVIGVMDGDAPEIGWLTFMHASTQVFVSWYGLVLFGLVTAYVFAREYGEGTAKEMLTLPIRRESFLAAKSIVLATWVLGLDVAVPGRAGGVRRAPRAGRCLLGERRGRASRRPSRPRRSSSRRCRWSCCSR